MGKTKLRTIREKQDMSILELSRLSGVSFEKVRQLDRGIKVESTSHEIKKAVADAIKESVLSVFQEVMTERLKEISRGQKLFMTIKVFLPDLKLSEKDQALWEKALDRMSRGEFLGVMGWNTDVRDCKQNMDQYIRKYNPSELIY